jgi:uncharacterized protein (DUF58 family)
VTTFIDPGFMTKLERLHLIAKRLNWNGAQGEHAATRKGSSLEFSDYRRYQRGDDLRYVDWNVYRRLDRLLIKVFTAEEEMNLYLVVDTSASMAARVTRVTAGDPGLAKIGYAKKVAAALGYIGLANLDRVGGAAFSATLHAPLRPDRGRAQILRLFAFLDALSCGGATDLHAAMRRFATVFPRPGLVVILSDLLDPHGWRPAVEQLTRHKHQVLVVHILDDDDCEPGFSGEVTLVDAEGSRERRLYIDEALERRFRAELAHYFRDIETACKGLGIDYLRTTTRVPFDEFVLKSLRQTASVS